MINIILKPDILKDFIRDDSRMKMYCKGSNSQRSILRLIKNKGRIDQFLTYIKNNVLMISKGIEDELMNLSINNNISVQFNIGVPGLTNNIININYYRDIKKKREILFSKKRGIAAK